MLRLDNLCCSCSDIYCHIQVVTIDSTRLTRLNSSSTGSILALQSEVIELKKKCSEVQIIKEYIQRKIESEIINLQTFQEGRERK